MGAYQMNPAKQFASRQDLIANIVEHTLAKGWYEDSRHSISLNGSKYEILVRELKTGLVVAYSSTKADFDQSLVEFIDTYFA